METQRKRHVEYTFYLDELMSEFADAEGMLTRKAFKDALAEPDLYREARRITCMSQATYSLLQSFAKISLRRNASKSFRGRPSPIRTSFHVRAKGNYSFQSPWTQISDFIEICIFLCDF